MYMYVYITYVYTGVHVHIGMYADIIEMLGQFYGKVINLEWKHTQLHNARKYQPVHVQIFSTHQQHYK